jgi:hypothetical protein
VVQLFERRRLLDAGRTLTPPEIQENDFPAVIREVDRIHSVVDGEVRSDPVRVHWTGAAIAADGKDQRGKWGEGNETRKPHVLIIRSDGY